jgi:hypothetical protein
MIVAFPQPVPAISEEVGLPTAACPLCHTADPVVTLRDLEQGADWRCGTCHQLWNARRLETVAAYARWEARRQAR